MTGVCQVGLTAFVPDVPFICSAQRMRRKEIRGKVHTVRVHHNTSLFKVSSGVALIEFVLKVDGDCAY